MSSVLDRLGGIEVEEFLESNLGQYKFGVKSSMARLDLKAGPYVRGTLLGAEITLAGVTLQGNYL